jgi:hypothetical protein
LISGNSVEPSAELRTIRKSVVKTIPRQPKRRTTPVGPMPDQRASVSAKPRKTAARMPRRWSG